VEALEWPHRDGIRVDAGIEVAAEVGPRFDPMLAKVIAHGADRREAFERLARALDETLVLGLVTNLRFLRWLVREPAVLDGQARIDTLERIWPPDDWGERSAATDPVWQAAAAALLPESGDPWAGGWRLNAPPSLTLSSGGEVRTVRMAPPTDEPVVVVAGDVVHVDVGGRSVPFALAAPPDVDRAARAASRHAGGSLELTAPMPGSVIRVHVEAGEDVEAGAPVVTLEAMKMEHVVPAPAGGRVDEVVVGPGDQVARGQPLASVTVSG
jgi:acetyl-CoA/propionyl-CoA carboxylase biotin carboxyl carrier protein